MLQEWKTVRQRIDAIKSQKSYARIPDKLYLYLVLAEDHRFESHFGCDPISLIRAFWQSTFKNKRQGGSTIAMQLVRTISGNYEISIKRKIKEIILAVKLTSQYSKQDILASYLSIAYLGWNMHGVEQACERLNIELSNISDYEAASIIARLKYPEPRYLDTTLARRVKRRTTHIINLHRKFTYNEQYGAI